MTSGHDHGTESCREIFARLSEYLDGELDAGICAEVDGHLGDCPPCRTFLESLRRTIRLLGDQAGPTMPDRVRREVFEAHARLKGREEGP